MRGILAVLLAIIIIIPMGCSRESKVTGESARLRTGPMDNLSMDDVKSVIRRYNFYDRFQNRNGSFINDFVDNGDGTVTDRATDLVWERHATAGLVEWSEVDSYIRELNSRQFAGYSDWRLPTIEELASLLGKEFRPLNISDIFTYDIGTGGNAYWSADTKEPGHAYYIDLLAATISLNFFGEDHPGMSIKAVRSE